MRTRKNRRLYKSSILIFYFFLAQTQVNGADWKEDLKKMSATYLSAQSFEMNVRVNTFAASSDLKPKITFSGKVAKAKDCYYSTMNGRTTLLNSSCFLYIDEAQKMILYTTNKEQNKAKADLFQNMNLDSAAMLRSEVRYLPAAKNQIRLEFKGKSISYDRIEIVMDALNYTLMKVTFYLKGEDSKKEQVERIEADYSETKLNRNIPQSFFSETKYIVKTGGKIKTSDAFKNYKLVDESKPVQP